LSEGGNRSLYERFAILKEVPASDEHCVSGGLSRSRMSGTAEGTIVGNTTTTQANAKPTVTSFRNITCRKLNMFLLG
jgi:hypothetical protein